MPILEPLTSSTDVLMAEASEDATEEPMTALTTPPARMTLEPVSLPKSTMIGDLKLTTLRSRLTTLGLSAEFAGEGLLVCSGGGTGDLEQTVAIRKTGRGKISVEGATGDVYFTVRKEIYSLHAIVAQPT